MSRIKTRKKTGKSYTTTRVSVVIIQDEQILLVKHRKGNRQYWVLPGGRLEYGETFMDCAVRELKEETNLIIEPERFLFLSEAIAPDRSRHIVNVYLQAKVIGGTMQLGDEPVLAGVDFIPLSELENITLFPPVGRVILETLANSSQIQTQPGMQYLGNLWV